MARSRVGEPRTIQGSRISLVPVDTEHLTAIQRWRADPDVTRYWITQEAPDAEEMLRWFQRNQADDTLTWTILEGANPIGYVTLFDIDPENQKAELAIMIGERRAWGQGYAREAITTLLHHAFAGQPNDGLGLHKVYLAVFAENAAARRAYMACGFREDGVLRDDMLRDGVWHDQIIMSVLSHEFAVDETREHAR